MYFRHAHDGLGAGHWVFGVLMLALMVAAIVALVMLVVRRPAPAGPPVDGRFLTPPAPAADAERILAERFARGEIDEAEFVSRRNALRSPS